MYELAKKRVFVAGHNGMVGRALLRALQNEDIDLLSVARTDCDLTRQADVEQWMQKARPDVVVICAARVGGILANDNYPVDFLYNNMMIAANIIRTAHQVGVEKLLFLGSSCIYPKLAAQPIAEDALLSGALEPTNQWYAIAKIAGIKLCQAYRRQYECDFIAAMPTNLYGPYDNFDLQSAHVIPALLHKCHLAKQAGDDALPVWGSGNAKREFMHVDDCAAGIVFLLKHYSDMEHINLGTGEDISIGDLAIMIKQVVGFDGALAFDATKPDGTPRKLLDVAGINALGWQAQTPLPQGLTQLYQWYKSHENSSR